MLLLSILIFLFPMAIYCWVLASINRRSRPTMVTGLWDCVGMLLAAGGILLMVGPVLVNKLFLRIMESVPFEEDAEEAFAQIMVEWWFCWDLYFVLLVLTIFFLLWWRRTKTVVYNVDPEMFGHVLVDSLEHLGLQTRRVGNRLIIALKLPGRAQEGSESVFAGEAPHRVETAARAPSLADTACAELAVEVFPAMCHVSLHWLRAEGNLRADIENRLALGLEGARTFDNPAAHWLLGLTGLLFGLIFLTGMIWILTLYLPRR